jgi:GMP synthase (glutamine-hydrolysing)
MKRAVVIEHDPSISLGNLEPVLIEAGYAIEVVDARHADLNAIDATAPDLVVVLGNDHGVYEKNEREYIAAEEKWLADRLAAERPTLGVCFGAQIMASALGGEVYKGDSTQIGYRSVTPTPAGENSPVSAFEGVPVVQWHGDTFTLPESVTRLAGSSDYDNEAFAIDNWALAVQFHPEVTPEMFGEWLEDGRESVEAQGLSEVQLLAEHQKLNERMQAASAQMLTAWLVGLER